MWQIWRALCLPATSLPDTGHPRSPPLHNQSVSSPPHSPTFLTTRYTPTPQSVLRRFLPPLRLLAFLAFLKSPSLSPFILLSPSFILLLTLLYFCNPLSPMHSFILLVNPSFYSISSLFLFSLLSSFPYALAMLPLSPRHSPALSSHQKVLDFDICLQEQWPMK